MEQVVSDPGPPEPGALGLPCCFSIFLDGLLKTLHLAVWLMHWLHCFLSRADCSSLLPRSTICVDHLRLRQLSSSDSLPRGFQASPPTPSLARPSVRRPSEPGLPRSGPERGRPNRQKLEPRTGLPKSRALLLGVRQQSM